MRLHGITEVLAIKAFVATRLDDRKILKRKRWVLLKGAEKLSPEQQGALRELMDANENLQKAYLV